METYQLILLYFSVIISAIITLFGVLLTIKNLFFDDKEYSDVKIYKKLQMNNYLPDTIKNIENKKFLLTNLNLGFEIKGDIFDLSISDKSFGLSGDYRDGQLVQFIYIFSQQKNIILDYKDSNGNRFRKEVLLTPLRRNKKSVTGFDTWKIELSNRRWLFFKSFKKYFE